MRLPITSNDLEWREVEPRHWVLYQGDDPYDGDLEESDGLDEL